MDDAFFDTNVLVYMIWQDRQKAARARELVEAGGWISVQVLNEFVSSAIRKNYASIPGIRAFLDELRHLCHIAPLDIETHDAALGIVERFGFHIYDAAIIAAAQRAGTTTLYSEDMQHGQQIGNLTITNPFR